MLWLSASEASTQCFEPQTAALTPNLSWKRFIFCRHIFCALLLLSENMESSRKRGRSDMWAHFKLIAPDKVQCSLCLGELKYHGNTSSMIRHFSTLHGATVNHGHTNQGDQKPDVDKALVKMLVKDSQPSSIVDSLPLLDSGGQPRKKGRSDMWEYFKLVKPDKVQCLVCSAELKYHGSTSSMIRHYTAKHGTVVNHGKANKGDRKRELDEALVNMLVKDSQPFSIVDDCGFKEFVALLDPTYTLPSKQTLKDMVIQRYEGQMSKIKAHIEDGDSDLDC